MNSSEGFNFDINGSMHSKKRIIFDAVDSIGLKSGKKERANSGEISIFILWITSTICIK